MRLSDAIRLGAMLHPQCFHWHAITSGNHVLKTCALGAASQAGYNFRALEALDDQGINYRCPIDDCIRGGLTSVIATLNDRHRWTRERIADWVESHEMQLQEQPAPVLAICETGPGR